MLAMGYLQRLVGLLSWSPGQMATGNEDDFGCLKCGETFDRQYRTCPECGGQFVAPLDEADENDP